MRFIAFVKLIFTGLLSIIMKVLVIKTFSSAHVSDNTLEVFNYAF